MLLIPLANNKEYAMAVRDFNKFFRRREKFIRQPYDDKKAFRRAKKEKKGKVDRCWSDSEEEDDPKKDEICLMAHDSNEVIFYTLYYNSSTLDDETLQNECNKLCKISLKIINKNKHLKTKIELLDKEVFVLKERLKWLEKNKEISEECKSCIDLRTKNESLALKLAKFKSSSHSLKEMIENQRLYKDKKGLGFTEHKTSTSGVKTGKISKNSAIKLTVDPAQPEPSEREPASTDEGYRATVSAGRILKPILQNRNEFVQITKKMSPSATIGNTKQPPALKLGQGLEKSKIQTRPKMPLRRPNTVFPKSNYHQVNWNYSPHQGYQFQPLNFGSWGPYPPYPYMNQPNGMYNANGPMRYWGLNA
ncbi:hypothetical protein Tco_0726284 [Tanacetum coccineum]|uniref:Uncharacterized protein n=1 Tax=Tanacetum coccineum TaxID=301880 RepID=A0ABQ4YGT1_9ASTR